MKITRRRLRQIIREAFRETSDVDMNWARDLYGQYKNWARDTGHHPWASSVVATFLVQHGMEQDRDAAAALSHLLRFGEGGVDDIMRDVRQQARPTIEESMGFPSVSPDFERGRLDGLDGKPYEPNASEDYMFGYEEGMQELMWKGETQWLDEGNLVSESGSYGGGYQVERDYTSEFIDYWERERQEDPDLDVHSQPEYDDVDAWSPNTSVTSHVWNELLDMRII